MSNQIRAFVGHSFATDDEAVVQRFLKYLTVIQSMNIGFSWEHAEPAEPKELAEKVLRLIADKNVFIGICTRKEVVIEPDKLRQSLLNRRIMKAEQASFSSKTSDWIIQEIGMAVGRDLDLILLKEEGGFDYQEDCKEILSI